MSDKIQFETNIPQTLALKYAAGKEVPSQFGNGNQVMYTATDGRVLFASQYLADQIDGLRLKPGEPFEICKREVPDGNRKRTEWQVSRAERSGANPTAPASTRFQGGSSSQDTPVKIPMDRALTMFLIMAGRSTKEAESTLGAEGGSVRFDSRDVAALATTYLIHGLREGWVSFMNTKTAQRYVMESKLREGVAETSKPAERALQNISFKPSKEAWKTRGEMKSVFSQLRELVGEVAYAKELERAGVSTADQFHSLNDARACYERLVNLAKQEAA